jgi:hypothetical protein
MGRKLSPLEREFGTEEAKIIEMTGRYLTPLERTFGIEEARIIEGCRMNYVRPIALGLIGAIAYGSWIFQSEIAKVISG